MALLREPVLYLSLYFKVHRATYYELLNRVRLSGDGETWLGFLADAVLPSAEQASMAAKPLLAVATVDARRIEVLGRAATSALALHRALRRQPLATSASLMAAPNLQQPR